MSNAEQDIAKYHDTSKLTHFGLVTPYGDIALGNIGSGNGLLPDATWTYDDFSSLVAFCGIR